MCVSENKLHFLQLYDKMSLIKVASYVLRVKKIHPGSPSDPSQTAAGRGEAELHIIHFKTTWSEFQISSQTAPAEAKPRCVYLNNYFDFHVCLSIRQSVPSSVCLCVRKIAQFPAVVSQNVTKKDAWYVLGVTLGHPHTPVGPLLPRRSRGAYIQF